MLRRLLPLAVSLPLLAQDAAPRWLPPAHPDRGLPDPAAVWCPYDADPQHVLNRVFRAFHVVQAVPAEVAAALPRERGDEPKFYAAGWYFDQRDGVTADARWFGGDARQLPRERFDDDEAVRLTADLAAIDGAVVTALRATPRLAVLFQSDLLRMGQRLLDTEANPELLSPLLAAAERVALPAAALQEAALRTFALADLAPIVDGIEVEQLIEIERRSTRLFDATFTGLWSSVFIAWPQGGAGLATWMADAARRPREFASVPIGTRAVLVQGIVAMDDQGKPRATDLVVDVRLQELVDRRPLAFDNATATRDGVDFRVFWLERQVAREQRELGLAAFREWAAMDQVLFRDYGSRKHTTVGAQCALCHRRTHTPDEAIAGFLALRPSAQPRPVTGPEERRQRAEAEFGRFLAVARAAAK